MTGFLPRVIGPANAAQVMLNDPNLSTARALDAGLVSKVAPADELVEAAHSKAEKLARITCEWPRASSGRVSTVSGSNELSRSGRLKVNVPTSALWRAGCCSAPAAACPGHPGWQRVVRRRRDPPKGVLRKRYFHARH